MLSTSTAPWSSRTDLENATAVSRAVPCEHTQRMAVSTFAPILSQVILEFCRGVGLFVAVFNDDRAVDGQAVLFAEFV